MMLLLYYNYILLFCSCYMIYIYLCIHIYDTHKDIYMYTNKLNENINKHIHLYISTNVCILLYLRIFTHLYGYMDLRIHIHNIHMKIHFASSILSLSILSFLQCISFLFYTFLHLYFLVFTLFF